MARMLGSIPPTQLCHYGCCTKWGPNPKTNRKVVRQNKHSERAEVRKETTEGKNEYGSDRD